MRTLFQLLTRLILTLSLVNAAFAQENRPTGDQGTSPTITAFASSDRVRFTSPSSVVQIRLELYNSTGKKLFDNEVRGGNVLDWHFEDGQAERIADDTYLCSVTVKSLGGKLTQRIGSLIFENGMARVTEIDVSRMTTQQSEAIGPVEENASLMVLQKNERQTPTVISHNGDEGQITRGRGALSFRIGDFFSGKETEQMRLTAEGNLGIGITHPSVKLDVDGLIRSSQGLVFPDGSIQFSAASKTLGAKSSRSGEKPSDGQDFQTQTAGTGTQNRIAKWIDNSGTLGNSVITETAGGFLGIGTPSPDSLFNVQGTIPSLLGHMGVIRTTGSNNGFGLLMDAAGSGNNSVGLAVNGVRRGAFSWDNSRSFLGFLNFNYSANDFSLRLNSNGSLSYHDSATSAERFTITAAGNVGIGTANPVRPLEIANGRMRFSSDLGDIEFTEVADLIGHATQANPVPTDPAFRVGTGTNSTLAFSVFNNGNVSIGTANVGNEKLRVEGGAINAVLGITTNGIGLYGITDNGIAIRAQSPIGDLMDGRNNSGRVFHITNAGTFVAGSDFAEALPARGERADYEAGDVLVVSAMTSATVEKSRRPYDVHLVGVYSTRPGMLGAEKNGISRVDPDELPVAIVGIVPTKVSTENGPVKAGDLLTTSSTPGYAMKASPARVGGAKVYRTGAILGKALEPLKEGKGVIKVLVTVR